MAKREEVERILDILRDSREEYRSLKSEDEFIEELDIAGHEISTQTYYSLLERKTRELEKINMLIRRLQQDEEFGLCEECGKPIPVARLMIVPEATTCVPCQREIEKLDSRQRAPESAFLGGAKKRDLDWEEPEDTDDKLSIKIESDMDDLSLLDLEDEGVEDDIDKNN
ncbi:MAG: TraR/DksA C4-type zinc finger protein [Deltaproteobacteria bacterium]|nr:TraR/DksA C4-type zinc finger protein [Deltaproteobacteria bacterium]